MPVSSKGWVREEGSVLASRLVMEVVRDGVQPKTRAAVKPVGWETEERARSVG